jgi:hypothetical protein
MKRGLWSGFGLLLLGTGHCLAQSAPQGAPPAAGVSSSVTSGPGCAPAWDGTPWTARPESDDACPRLSVRAEYLLWWIKDAPSVPLLTTGDQATSGLTTGQIGNGDTTVLLGRSRFGYPAFSGLRLTADYWLHAEQAFGIQASGFLLEQRAKFQSAASDAQGNPVLARPIIDAATGTESVAAFVAFPAPFPGADPAFTGGLAVASRSRLWGTDVNVTGNFLNNSQTRVNGLVGFRYLDLTESLNVSQSTTILPTGLASFEGQFLLLPGDHLAIADYFGTRNQFYGAQVGAEAHFGLGKLALDGVFKVALGCNHEAISTRGSTTLTAADLPQPLTASGGVLALPTNIGHHTRDEFAVVPEVGITAGYQITSCLRATVGYTLLYWSDAVRPGNEVTRVVNPLRIPSSAFFDAQSAPAAPAPFFKQVDFWAQGINFGLEFRY